MDTGRGFLLVIRRRGMSVPASAFELDVITVLEGPEAEPALEGPAEELEARPVAAFRCTLLPFGFGRKKYPPPSASTGIEYSLAYIKEFSQRPDNKLRGTYRANVVMRREYVIYLSDVLEITDLSNTINNENVRTADIPMNKAKVMERLQA